MNKTEVEQIIKKANETIENYNNLITSFKSEIEKVENVKTEAEKELKKINEVPECHNETNVRYYFVNFDGSVSEEPINPNFEWDKDILESHRAFKNLSIAHLFSDKTQIIADQLYFKELYDADFVPDWSDGCGLKFYLVQLKLHPVYNNSSYPKTYFVDNCCGCASGETVYFSSKEIAKKCADWLNSRKENK